MLVVPEAQTSAVESLKQRGIIRFDIACRCPFFRLGVPAGRNDRPPRRCDCDTEPCVYNAMYTRARVL